MVWYDVSRWDIEGKGWENTEKCFDRLPEYAKQFVNAEVWRLSKNTAGMSVCFISDSSSITIRYRLTSEGFQMGHMPKTGVSGVDLYYWDEIEGWKWVAVGGKKIQEQDVVQQLISGLLGDRRIYQLYLPLYNGVESMELGFLQGSFVEAFALRTDKPIVFYGGSAIQGACASRPGMCLSAIVGRHLDKPVINLGFSGQGDMSLGMISLLKELDPCVYVLDYLGNMPESIVKERTLKLVRDLRKAGKQKPIVLVELRSRGNESILPEIHKEYSDRRQSLKMAFDELIASGIEGIYWMPGEGQIGTDGEATVDGVHPTDLGFMRMAAVYESFLKPLISEESHPESER